MRAIRHDGARFSLDPRSPEPVIGPGEAIIRLLRVALGPADARAEAVQDSPPRPSTPGREFVGVVERLAEPADRDLRRRWEGKRVVGSPVITCTRCDLCRAGLSAHCRARRTLGTPEWDGCLAERFGLPLRNLVETPRDLDDDRAVFATALGAAAHLPQVVRIEGKPFVTILGDSAEALLAAQVLARLNASVRLLGQDLRKVTLCERWGIKHRHMDDVGRRADQDIVVDCTGSAAGLALGLQLVRPRGKVVLAAGGVAGASLDAVVEHEIELVGARGGSPAEALGLLARNEIDVLPLITRRMRLADGETALRSAADPAQIRVVVEP